MTYSEQKLRDALVKIAEAAQAAMDSGQYVEAGEDDDDAYDRTDTVTDPGAHCTIRQLPVRLVEQAAKTAIAINPTNRVNFGPLGALAQGVVMDPLQIAVLVGKYWGPRARSLTVSFLDGGPSDLRRKIVEHLNAWNRTAGISFVETGGVGDVRISRNLAGYWSYLGTDILHIPRNRPTLNLQDFSMNTPDSEFHRVVRHEAGHTLGFPHEHMREELVALLDREKAYDFFLRTQGWDRQTVDQQVLTPLSQTSIMGTEPDQDSIMCYQLPGSITRSGNPIRGGSDINSTDAAFAAQIYPKGQSGSSGKGSRRRRFLAFDNNWDWPAADDVVVEHGLVR